MPPDRLIPPVLPTLFFPRGQNENKRVSLVSRHIVTTVISRAVGPDVLNGIPRWIDVLGEEIKLKASHPQHRSLELGFSITKWFLLDICKSIKNPNTAYPK